MRVLTAILLLAVAVAIAYFGIPASKPSVPATPTAGVTPPASNPPRNEITVAPPPSPSRPLLPPRDPTAQALAEISGYLRFGTAFDRDWAVNVLLPKLVARDPSAATRLVETWEAGPLREELLRHLARLMSASDIHATMAWLSGLPEVDQTAAAAAVVAQVNQTDPAGAIGLAEAFRVGLDDGRQEHLMQLWTEEHPAAAVAWVTSQPAGPSRDRLVARAAHVRAQRDAREASRLVLNFMQPGPAQEDALMAVVRQWAVRDPAAAAAWVHQFPSGPLLSLAQGELATARKLR